MMRSRASSACIVLAALTSSCGGLGMMQSAQTLNPGRKEVGLGITRLKNTHREGDEPSEALLPDTRFRFGIVRRLDAGISGFMHFGGLADLKYSLLPPRRPAAIALRAGGGYGVMPGYRDKVAQAGFVASYSLPWLTGYAGGTFVNHWICPESRVNVTGSNGDLVGRKGYGNGILQVGAGFIVHTERGGSGALLEYDYWIPAQNDPGDSYKFESIHILQAGFRF